MRPRDDTGFSLIELLIVVAIIGLLAAIAVPGLMRARVSGNEASGIASLRTIVSGETAFSTTCANGGYATSLSQLFAPPLGNTEGFVSPDLALDATKKAGYIIALAVGSPTTVVLAKAATCNQAGDATASFLATADPLIYGRTGMRHFATTERGSIFQDTSDTALTVSTLVMAGTIAPLQ